MSKRKSKYLGSCNPEHSFWVSDGQVFNNYSELSAGLKRMHKDTFSQHVNADKNDFHAWVKDVFGDARLARQLKAATTKTSMQRTVQSRIKSLRSR